MILSQHEAACEGDFTMKTVRIAGTSLEPLSPESESIKDWIISSENYLQGIIDKTAYSIGAILGDGHMRYIPSHGNGSWYSTELAGMDIEVLEKFQSEILFAFGKSYPIHTKRLKSGIDFFTVRASSGPIHHFFWGITSGKQEIPSEIFRSSDDTKRSFVAGLMDTDGTVKLNETWNGSKTNKNPRWQLGFANTKLGIVESLASLLHSMGVKVGNIQSTPRGSYRTIYNIHPNIRSFIDAGFYFQAKRKQERLNDYLLHVVGSETMHTASVTSDEDIVRS